MAELREDEYKNIRNIQQKAGEGGDVLCQATQRSLVSLMGSNGWSIVNTQ